MRRQASNLYKRERWASARRGSRDALAESASTHIGGAMLRTEAGSVSPPCSCYRHCNGVRRCTPVVSRMVTASPLHARLRNTTGGRRSPLLRTCISYIAKVATSSGNSCDRRSWWRESPLCCTAQSYSCVQSISHVIVGFKIPPPIGSTQGKESGKFRWSSNLGQVPAADPALLPRDGQPLVTAAGLHGVV